MATALGLLFGIRSVAADPWDWPEPPPPSHGSPAAAPASLLTIVSDALPRQYLFLLAAAGGGSAAADAGGGLRSAEPADGPPLPQRQLALAASLVGLLCGLVGSVGHLLVLAPPSLVLSACLVPLCSLLVIVEGDGPACAHLAGSVLRRVPVLSTAGGRAAIGAVASLIGSLAGPTILSAACSPLLLLSAAADATAHIASVGPLARLHHELGSQGATQARFAAADVEGAGCLQCGSGALSRLTPAIPPGSTSVLRGVAVALTPLGGHRVTLEGLEAWRRQEARWQRRRQQQQQQQEEEAAKAAAGEDPHVAASGGDLLGRGSASSYFSQSYFSQSGGSVDGGGGAEGDGGIGGGVLAAAAGGLEAATWQEQLLQGPPGGGWAVHAASGCLALSAALLCAAAALGLLSSFPPIWLNDAPSLLFTLLLPSAATLWLCASMLAVDLALVPIRAINVHALPVARSALSQWAPLSLGSVRALVLLASACVLWQALPASDGVGMLGLGGSLLSIAALWSTFFACAALWMGGAADYALMQLAENAAEELADACRASAHPGHVHGALRPLLEAAGCPYLVACVALDLDRDGSVSEQDVSDLVGSAAWDPGVGDPGVDPGVGAEPAGGAGPLS